MSDIGDFINTFYKGTPLGSPVNTTGTSSFGSADKLRPDGGKIYADPIDNIISDIFGWEKDTGGVDQPAEPGHDFAKDVLGAADADQPYGDPGKLLEGLESGIARITIIILGFIFVAVGLSMFRQPAQMVTAALLPP